MKHVWVALFLLSNLAHSADLSWKITRTQWTDADEKYYSEFVQRIGEGQCYKLENCLRSAANPYRDTDPPNLSVFSDCSKLPYLLRAYFAWKNGLPFSFET